MSQHQWVQAKTATAPAVAPAPRGRIQRKCACGGTPGHGGGECADCRRRRMGGGQVQTKLRVGSPNDRFEQEADRVADAVLAGAGPAAALHGQAPSLIQRLSIAKGNEHSGPSSATTMEKEERREDKEQIVQRQAADGAAATATVSPAHLASVQQGGQPLDPATRAFFEPRFGHSFEHVRVHADGADAALAQDLNARAFTIGRHIVFGRGEYAPISHTGRRLLAHELTHVLQQGGGRPRMVQRQELTEPAEIPAPPALEEAPTAASSGGATAAPVCDPDRALTWADFTGSPPTKGSKFAAMTKYDYKEAGTTP